jgi:glycerol kinase
MDDEVRAEERDNWRRAVERTFDWVKRRAGAADG